MNPPLFPGATEFSLVSLYDDMGSTCTGGTPHLHTACTEAYITTSGNGSVETLSSIGGHQHHQLTPGSVVWFTPGVIHRGVPSDTPVEVLVLMQNAGLPEAGDAVLTLPSRFWSDPDAYADIVSISADSRATQRELVIRRRELAMEGFQELVERYDSQGATALEPFFAFAQAVVAPRIDAMLTLIEETAAAEVATTQRALTAMRNGSFAHLVDARVAQTTRGETRFGMCGHLAPYRSAHEQGHGEA